MAGIKTHISSLHITGTSAFWGILYITLMLTAGFYFIFEDQHIDLLSASAVPITVFFLLLFVVKLGEEFPVKEIMVLLTAVQFLYSPFLAYYFYEPDPIYPMEVEPADYFGYAVPGVLLFALGLYVFKHPAKLHDFPGIIRQYNIELIGRQLIVMGLLADIGIYVVPGSLKFFMLLLSYSKFIGAYYLLFSHYRFKRRWIMLAFSPLLVQNVAQGMFHELLLWGVFSLMIFFITERVSFFRKAAILLVGFVSIYFLNLIKKEYREATWVIGVNYSVTDKLMIFAESTLNVFQGDIENEEEFEAGEHNLTRLNQGVIVSRVMSHTGRREPFAEGETVEQAIMAALVPRVLNPNKVRSGGRDTYERFTGYGINAGTSISLSLLGEGYANYGYGGIFFMFFLGLFYSFVLYMVLRFAHREPYLLLWIPFLFLPVIKAEEGFETVLNYLIKALLVLFVIHKFYLKRYTHRVEEEAL